MNVAQIDMKEWQVILPQKSNELLNRFFDSEDSRQLAEKINSKGIIGISEMKNGIQLESNSYVGKVKIGDLQINIKPKIEGLPLYKLLKYTYSLRDLEIFENAIHGLNAFPFHDILIHQLYAEVEDLLFRGLNRRYIKYETDLGSPRGRIDLNKLFSRNIIDKSTLPCRYYERSEDNELNQVLFAGLKLAIELTDDFYIRSNLHRICNILEDSISRIELTRNKLLKTLKSMNRLSERYRPALELINILYESQGIQFEDSNNVMKLNGFFFDMNSFFQSLISKLLKENLEGFIVKDEFTLHDLFAYAPNYNPLKNSAPKPRPDFAISKNGKVISLLDAKYRDLWETSLPSQWLYQLSIYAISGYGNKSAKILYPTMYENADIQKIDIKDPTTGSTAAQVVLQPISMLKIADLIDLPINNRENLKEYIKSIVF